jgi:pseudouridine-5'-phosphate glycosidase
MKPLPDSFVIAPEIARALRDGRPLVALETTVVTHGLPHPDNLTLAANMEATLREGGAVPATIGVLEGQVRVGLEPEELERLAGGRQLRKISLRDFGPAIAKKESGGTTVAGTLHVAHTTGIRVFATGGIGGVHRVLEGAGYSSMDISADLPALAHYPLVVVCAGAKAILDLPATIEYLETAGVLVVGYQTDDFPAFYSSSSGLGIPTRADSSEEVAAIAQAHWGIGMARAVLVAAPPPASLARPREQVEAAIQTALEEAAVSGVSGQAVTPFLLERVSALTGGSSLQANLGLLLNNAQIAARIARSLSIDKSPYF